MCIQRDPVLYWRWGVGGFGLTVCVGCWYTVCMKTTVSTVTGGGVGVKKLSSVRGFFARVVKFFDGLIVRYYYKGERLRPEVREEIEQEIEDEKRGKSVPSPRFTTTEDAVNWLKS